VLFAYLDESGTHAQSPVAMIGGFVASSELWARLEPDWTAVLDTFEIPYFHASECEAGDGIYQNLSRTLRELLSSGLSQVIAKHKPTAIYTAITRAHFNETRARGVEAFESPYHACFEFCLQQIAQWSKDNADGEPIALVFAEQEEYEDQARVLYELYRKNRRWGKELVSLAHSQPKKLPALQAADLIVYEKTRHEVERRANPNAKLRPAIEIMGAADVRAIDYPYDVEILKEIIR
jgi:hypothetical protein